MLEKIYSHISRLSGFGFHTEIYPFVLTLNLVLIKKLNQWAFVFFLFGLVSAFITSRSMYIFVLLLIFSLDNFKLKTNDIIICLYFLILNILYLSYNTGMIL